MSRLRDLVVATAATGCCCVAYGVLIESRWFRRRHVTLPGAVRRGRDLRVLQIADTHLTPPEPRMAAFLAETAAVSDPDLVVAAGDLLGAVGAEDATVDLLAPLVADGRPGIVTLGSNDMYAPTPLNPFGYFTGPSTTDKPTRLDTDRFVAGLEATGWVVLRDEWGVVDVDGRDVLVTGMEDPHVQGWEPPDDALLVPPSPIDVDAHLGIVHAPYLAAVDQLVDLGVDAVLCGHTHGGQVRLPGIGALVGNCDLPLDRIRGASRWRDTWLHVTPGMGQSRYAPYRFACRPEATVLDLTS